VPNCDKDTIEKTFVMLFNCIFSTYCNNFCGISYYLSKLEVFFVSVLCAILNALWWNNGLMKSAETWQNWFKVMV